MSRKLLAIFSALLITASLCACNNVNGNEETTENHRIDITEATYSGDVSEEETPESGSEIKVPDIETDYTELEYTETNEKVYIIHPNGAVLLHGSKDVSDTSLANGAEVTRVAISTDGEWSKVIYEEKTYYVYSKCLTTLENFDEGFVPCDLTVELAEGVESLSVRNTPTMDTHVVGYVYSETPIKVIALNTETGWYKVEYTPYGSDETAYGYIVSDAKWYKASEETTEAVTEEVTEATSEESTVSE